MTVALCATFIFNPTNGNCGSSAKRNECRMLCCTWHASDSVQISHFICIENASEKNGMPVSHPLVSAVFLLAPSAISQLPDCCKMSGKKTGENSERCMRTVLGENAHRSWNFTIIYLLNGLLYVFIRNYLLSRCE